VLTESGVVRSDTTTSFGQYSGTATGVPMTMQLTVVHAGTGAAYACAAVYAWHCDAKGLYSLYSQGATNQNYCRGVQAADSTGALTFKSVFPAAYMGRLAAHPLRGLLVAERRHQSGQSPGHVADRADRGRLQHGCTGTAAPYPEQRAEH